MARFSNLQKTGFIIPAIMACAAFSMAHASEQLVFTPDLSKPEYHTLKKQIGKDQTLEIAPIDLNEDGLDEYILRPASCSGNNAVCAFTILAESGNTVHQIGEIPARRLEIGNGRTQGILNILAYENTKNDYTYKIYNWNPEISAYEVQE